MSTRYQNPGRPKAARPTLHAFVAINVPTWLTGKLLEEGWVVDKEGYLNVEGEITMGVLGGLLSSPNTKQLSMSESEDESSSSDSEPKHEEHFSTLKERSKKRRRGEGTDGKESSSDQMEMEEEKETPDN